MRKNESFELPVVLSSGVEELTTVKLPSPDLLTYYQDYERRIVWIDYEIDDSLIGVSRDIINWNLRDEAAGITPEKRQPIILFIFTNGGDLDAAYNFIDVCRMSKTPIITVCSKAYSAGLLLLLCGHKRYTLPLSEAMLHTGSGAIQGTFEQVEESVASYKRAVKKMKSFILERTSITEEVYEQNKAKDWYMDADDQLKYGVVHGVLSSFDEIL